MRLFASSRLRCCFFRRRGLRGQVRRRRRSRPSDRSPRQPRESLPSSRPSPTPSRKSAHPRRASPTARSSCAPRTTLARRACSIRWSRSTRTHPTAYPDALFLLGETYFESKQYLSARRVFRQIVERGGERGFANYQSRALARLIDVALRTQDYATLDEVFAKINQLPPYVGGRGAQLRPRQGALRQEGLRRCQERARGRRPPRVRTITRRATSSASSP